MNANANIVTREDTRTIDRFPEYAFASSGEVISFTKGKPRILIGSACGKYRSVQLRRADGNMERAYVHRIIAEAFYGPCPLGMECRHLDGNSDNNSAANLSWGSRKENAMDRVHHKTASIGEKHGHAKLTEAEVRQMRAMRQATGRSYHKIASDFGVSPMTAHRAITGKLWRNV